MKKTLPAGIREHHGKFQVRYRGPDGKERTKSFRRLTDAKAHKAAMETDKRRGLWLDPRKAETPFDRWITQWHEGRNKLRGPARRRDDSLIRHHIIGRDKHPWGFGSTPVGRISPLDVREWVNQLVAAGYSPRTIAACYRVFGGAMRAAVAAKMIPESPAGREVRDVVDLPKIERKRERFLTHDELERLASEITHHYRPLVLAAAWTGCRWQELAGLLRENLDIEAGKLHVRTVVERGSTDLKTFAKSDAGYRTISLPDRLVETLRFHLAGAPESELVFPGPQGAMLNEGNFRRRHWNPAVEKAGLAPLTFHDLRHTHTSWLIANRWPEFQIVKRLGWTDSRMLYRVYGHLFENDDEALVKALGERDADQTRTKRGPRRISDTA